MSNASSNELADVKAVLRALIVGKMGRRRSDGSIVIRRKEPRGQFLYGPFWRLAQGSYCLEVTCSLNHQSEINSAFMGIEIIAQNMNYVAVRDYCPNDAVNGRVSLFFHVPSHLSFDQDNDVMFSFRFLNYGGAAFTISSVTLRSLTTCRESEMLKWQLFPRLCCGWLDRCKRSVGRPLDYFGTGNVSLRFRPSLKLPTGSYDLSFRTLPNRPRFGLQTQTRVRVMIGRRLHAAGTYHSSGTSFRKHSLEFDVSDELAFDNGSTDEFELRIGRSDLIDLESLELTRLSPAPNAKPKSAGHSSLLPSPRIVGKAQVNMVIIGNCQAELLAAGFRKLGGSRQLIAKYHFVRLQRNLRGIGRMDLEKADIILIQEIADFENYPLREEIPSKVESHRFPMLRFSTPWPFDSFNGLADRHAQTREAIEPLFPNLDGILGRLRLEIPDKEARFRAYLKLDIDRIGHLSKLPEFEQRRLEGMDQQYGFGLGSYILENFRRQQIFHSIGHPHGRLLTRLMLHLNQRVGLSRRFQFGISLNNLSHMQIPVHPLVARRLGIRWASEKTRYEFRGEKVTWEEYTRRYICHFG
jgi:Polysaccharide biosynthesis enzyme WcbI